MNLFLDTNVVIDYLAKRESFAEDIYRLIMACSSRDWQLSISALSFTTIYYVLHKQCEHKQLLDLLSDVRKAFCVCDVDGEIIKHALHSDFHDFEDAVQCFTAQKADADVIITRNVKDFVSSPILVKTPKEFNDILSGYGYNSESSSSLLNEPTTVYGQNRD